MTMRTALVQLASPLTEPVPSRRERVGAMVAEAAAGGAELVLLPELWAPGYFAFDRYDELAEPLSGDAVRAMAEWARSLRVYLLGGSVLERAADLRLFNTAVLLGPDGALLHAYRKVHVFGYRSLEAKLLSPGRDISVVATGFGAVGVTTCYDLRFPEIFRLLADAGATVLGVPAAWPAARLAHWRLFTQVRAVENQAYLLACNAAGEQGDVPLAGNSRVVDPWGDVLAEAGDGEEIVYVDLDPERVAAVRREFPVLDDRRLFVAPAALKE